MKERDQEEVLEAETSEEEETEDEESEESEEVDYKGELEKANKLLEKKDKQIGQAEHVIEELKKDGKIDPSIIEELIEKKFSTFTEQIRGDAIDSMVHSYSSNEDEAELIKYHLKNSIRPSGDDEADILNAKALANKSKFTQQASERRRAEMRQEPDKAKGAGAKEEVKKTPKLSKEASNIAKAFGLSKEEIESGYRR